MTEQCAVEDCDASASVYLKTGNVCRDCYEKRQQDRLVSRPDSTQGTLGGFGGQ